jgi:hypothetical protein
MTNTLFLASLAAQEYPPDSLTDALVQRRHYTHLDAAGLL